MTASAAVSPLEGVGTSPIPAILAASDRIAADLAELEDVRGQIAGAVGVYECTCGGAFELPATAGLDDYAALNRWLGVHVPADGRCLQAVLASYSEDLRSARLQAGRGSRPPVRGW